MMARVLADSPSRSRTGLLAVAAGFTLVLAACVSGEQAAEPDPTGSSAPAAPGTDEATPTESATDTPDDLDIALNDPQPDPFYPDVGEPGVDALHYRIDLTWDPETRRLDGIEGITFRATADAEEIRLDFTTALDVKGVTVDGAGSDFSHRNDKLRIHRPVEADERYEVQLQYGGTPQPTEAPSKRSDFDGLGLHVTDRGELWTMQEPYGAFTWYAVNDHPSDKALYDFTLTVPEPWTGVANGTLTETTTTDGQRTTRWHLPQPASSYLVTVAFADYTLVEQETASGIPVRLYRFTRDAGSMGELEYAAEAMAWVEEKLGPYPFDTIGAVVVDSASAMETQTMMTMGHSSYTLSRPVLVHEIVHQWYGNTVSPDNWSDVWMNEGMTMYLEFMWRAEHEAFTDINTYMEGIRPRAESFREEHGPPAAYDPDDFGQSNIYYVPAVMWHELRDRIGEETFWEMVRAWPTEQAGRTSNREEYVAWVEEFTGEELSDFFDAWLFGDGT